MKRVGLFVLGMAMAILSMAQSADFSAEGSRKQMESLGNRDKINFVNKHFYALYSADFKNAKELAQWAATIAGEEKWILEEAYAQMNWGVITYLSGDYDQVLDKYFKSLSLFESLQDQSGISAVNNEMAVFYHKQNKLDDALKCLDVAEKNAREVNDLEHLGTTLGHRGSFLSRRGKFKEAEPFVKEVLKIRTQQRDSVGLGYVLLDLSELALNDGKPDLALHYMDESTQIRHKIGDRQGVATNAVTKGEIYLGIGHFSEAIRWLTSGLKQAREIGYTDLERFTLGTLADACLKNGDYRSAYEFRTRHQALSDSLLNLDKVRVIEEMQARFDSEKKESEIKLLRQENDLKDVRLRFNQVVVIALLFLVVAFFVLGYLVRNRMALKQKVELEETKAELRALQLQAVITSQENERRRFAADLHDGLGQLISAVRLNLSKEEVEKRSIDQAVEVLNEMNNEIRNIAFNLMPQVLINSGLKEALDELAARVNRSGKIKVVIGAFDLIPIEETDKKVALYRVCQEWINNVIKYSGCTQINLQLVQHAHELVITIEDNGRGFDSSVLEKGQGNGWRNINSRLAIIQGMIEVDSSPLRTGTIAIITVPVSLAKAA